MTQTNAPDAWGLWKVNNAIAIYIRRFMIRIVNCK